MMTSRSSTDLSRRPRALRAALGAAPLLAALSGCALFNVSGDPRGTPPLKQAVDGAAVAATEIVTGSSGSAVTNAQRWPDGSWTWDQRREGSWYHCRGPRLGVASECHRT